MSLVFVQGSIRLEANAAASFSRVDAKFGGGLTITGPYGGHRFEADQTYLRNGYVRGLPGFNYAAPPRQSNHEGKAPDWEGFAVDISNYRQFPGLHAAMVAEGWVRDPVELWHYNYTGRRTQVVGVAGNVISITPAPVALDTFKEYTDMILVNCTDIASQPNGKGDVTAEGQNRYVFIAPGYFSITNDKTVANDWHRAINASNPNWVLRGQKDPAGKATDWSSVAPVTRAELARDLYNIAGWSGNVEDLVNGQRWSAIPGFSFGLEAK